jgi:hypothetical protein
MTDSSTSKTTFLNIFDIFVDAQSVVARLDHQSSWLYPLILISAGTFLTGLANMPTLARVVENSLPLGIPEEQVKQTMESILKYQKIGVYLIPFGLLLKWLGSAALLFLSCVTLNINAGFKHLFALISQCGLITFLQELTICLIMRVKGRSIQTVNDLSPQLGLDLLFTNLGKPLMLILNYFSIFNISYIFILTVSLAYLGGCSRSRAFFATLPICLLPLVFGLGMLLFQID